MRFIQERGMPLAVHNAFKSDAYSLGLVFLYMATLQEINDSFKDLDNLSTLISERLESIKYYFIKVIIKNMLKINEEERFDFVQLSELIDKIEKKNSCIKC